MNKETSETISIIKSYLMEAQDSTPEEIGFQITNLLIEHSLVSDQFLIEVVPLNNCYVLRSRNLYTTNLVGAMPGFCRVCGKLVGKTSCTHK